MDKNEPIDIRKISRQETKAKAGTVEHAFMAVEAGSLQRIADSLERMERLAYTSLLSQASLGQIALHTGVVEEMRTMLKATHPNPDQLDQFDEL